ncbi:MAG TPA: 2-C-methyl-D-erythritol 2,4-cyclodiphosphate synthase [Actinomycetota bacterium]|nr:2-C-methyl-D-erythritol 2,4-cyclodiphosphate synthase [Actinomycetota bacterium]
MAELRFGLGFDVHPRGDAPPLLLGGVRFEDEMRLEGHSDADVVCHSVADALLGAAALGDLGTYFPDDDASTAGMGGMDLLAKVVELIREGGLRPSSCDIVVVTELPAIAPRRDEMRANLSQALGVPIDRISIKATRPEGMGLTGDGAACLALAVATTS